MKQYFIGNHGRLRALWRILLFILLFIAITAPLMMGVREILGAMPVGSVLQLAVVAVGATLAVFIARKVIDQKSIASLGVTFNAAAIRDLVTGIILSFLTITAFFVITLYKEYIAFDGLTWWSMDSSATNIGATALLGVVFMLVAKFTLVAWWEELVMRGYLLRNLIDGMGVFWAVVVSSAVFGLGHAFNPSATILSNAIIMLISLQLVYAYLASGQLWLPVGLHLGWNFTQASIFGFSASGQDSPSLLEQHPTGPNWLSGGAFGPEESILIIPPVLVSVLVIYFYTRGRTVN